MKPVFDVELSKIVEELNVDIAYTPVDLSEIKITSADVNRPGLQLVGFFDYFDDSRIQIIGKVEKTYLETMNFEQRVSIAEKLMERRIPALIYTRDIEPSEEILESAKKYAVPVLRTTDTTSSFMSSLIATLNLYLAERITRHGVLVEVYGEGILLLGDSGVGKSETAMELLKRGHRLIADDAVEIKRVSNRTLVGTSPDIIKHFIELRGIGIIDVRRIFGMGAIKESEKINLVVELEYWDENKQYDRLGLDNTYAEILGLKVPSLVIPVKSGRNLAIIIEVAAMNSRQKRMGYNAAAELNQRLIDKSNMGI